MTMTSVCIYLHRGMAHQSMKFHPWLQHTFRFWLWLTDGVNVREWVVTHRKHHRYTDKPGDPHSPSVQGIKVVAWDNFISTVVQRYKSNPTPLEMEVYSVGCPNDWLEKVYATKVGLVIMLIIDVLLFDRIGILVWLVQIAWTPFWTCTVVNGLCHYGLGYQVKGCQDNSRNIPLLGLFLIGDEYHSNHHTHPGSPKLSRTWYEFDLSWAYIKVLKRVGMIHV